MTASITFVLMLTMAVSLVAIPTVNAKRTYPYIGAIPNPVGAGEQVLLHIGITDQSDWEQGGWEGLTVTITKPDGTTETIGPYTTDLTGGTGGVYTPDQVGTYKLVTNFPEQVITAIDGLRSGPAGTVMEANSSPPLDLVVQAEPIPIYPGFSLPTEYWSRPIDAQIREWATVAGNWLDGKGYYGDMNAPYNDDAPETAHILWAQPIIGNAIGALGGGLVGGMLPGPQAFEDGDAYEDMYVNPVVIAGVLYVNRYKDNAARGADLEQEVVAVDLRTGEELWVRNWNNAILDFGQTMYWDSFNYHAVFGYLWSTSGSTWNAYETATGRYAFSFSNVPSGERRYGPKGEILVYSYDLEEGWMSLWNSTKAGNPQDQNDSDDGSWLTRLEGLGITVDATRGMMWNVSIPTGDLPDDNDILLEDRLIGTNFGRGDKAPDTLQVWAISTAPGQVGQLLFNTSWDRPFDDIFMSLEGVSVEDGVFTVHLRDTGQHYGFDINTGDYLWGPTAGQYYLHAMGFSSGSNYDWIYDGKLFSAGWGGIVYCYDVKTGELLWTYEASDPYNEFLFAPNWSLYPSFIADGKLYVQHGEHSPIDPKPRGGPFFAVDIDTGEEVWRINGAWATGRSTGNPVIGDSIIAAYDVYDQRVYGIGKGPSQTTVTASPKVIANGASVLIEGSVMDISAGTKQKEVAARFPNGVPAMADEDMSEWMLYVYKQFGCPTTGKGVEVTLDTIDPNGNWVSIGRATTDMTGMFSYMWTPEIEGKYTVMATFEGSKSYWPSYVETAIGVTEAPSPGQPIEPEPTEAPLITTEVAIIAAVIIASIIGVVSFWALRKRK